MSRIRWGLAALQDLRTLAMLRHAKCSVIFSFDMLTLFVIGQMRKDKRGMGRRRANC